MAFRRSDAGGGGPSQGWCTVERAVFFFGDGKADGDGSMKSLLGGKGAGLAEMTRLGLPVPPGFTITTAECVRFYNEGRVMRPDLRAAVLEAMQATGAILGRRFGDASRPLLVSVRSGARASMPGMMDTILNLGLNDDTVRALIEMTDNPRFGWDSYRRFIQMFGDVVLEVPHSDFEHILDGVKRERGVHADTELGADDLERITQMYKECVERRTGAPFPSAPEAQLWAAIEAVFASWYNDRAMSYRRLNRIPHDWGTAANVQAMVFGNMGEDSATGVAFTRDPSTGENHFYGEYLTNAQGEDVVAGIRTPNPLTRGQKQDDAQVALEDIMPETFAQLCAYRDKLELHFKDMLDLEFTVERGKLWMLQTRAGKRTGLAAVRIAADMVREGRLNEREALLRIDAETHLVQLLHPRIDPASNATPLAKGLNASPGAATGAIVFTADDAVATSAAGRDVVLVRTETSPEDIEGMAVARAILTARGGRTSHAAVVARGMGRVCVAGCSSLSVDTGAKTATFSTKSGPRVLHEGAILTLDGTMGHVFEGAVPTVDPELSGDYELIMQWADQHRRMRVRANADTPADAVAARRLGAEGIGLCRTEHMFFGEERLPWVRKMILAKDANERRESLARLEPMQRSDFIGIFEAMDGLPVTIRLLDPPLHEFVPHTREDAESLARELDMSADVIWRRSESLREMNPMLGHRGARLGITFPEIYAMQAEAIFAAALEASRRGIRPLPEIMLPLIGTSEEYRRLEALVREVAAKVFAGIQPLPFLVGTMIEVPRAALIADRIAEDAEFFSFGTNDLTQLVYGYSRDDAEVFLPVYVEQGILPRNPFESLDAQGVGAMVRMATERGRSVRPNLKVGICGEHGGDPVSVEFFHQVGLDYVSCSPYRVPVARLAAAQATVRET
ncbi:MAG TPA: pyruvate, phosphate dikinase [Candidatus Krumholzibacteria bacterium]|nr:pyruvate, phosphate dikinase [Candidatus Krumholzibacteria bacterium]